MHPFLNIQHIYALTWPPPYLRHRTLNTTKNHLILLYSLDHLLPILHASLILFLTKFWNITPLSMFLPNFQTFQFFIVLRITWNLLNDLSCFTWVDVCLLSLVYFGSLYCPSILNNLQFCECVKSLFDAFVCIWSSLSQEWLPFPCPPLITSLGSFDLFLRTKLCYLLLHLCEMMAFSCASIIPYSYLYDVYHNIFVNINFTF